MSRSRHRYRPSSRLMRGTAAMLFVVATAACTAGSSSEPDASEPEVQEPEGVLAPEGEPGVSPEAAPSGEPGASPEGEPSVGPEGEPESVEPDANPIVACAPERIVAPVRRLTRREYNFIVEDLLGVTSRPADAFAPEETALGFDNNASALWVSQILAEQYIGGAETVGDVVTETSDALSGLLPCDPAAVGERVCAAEFVTAFGRRAFRRPVAAPEHDALMALYDDVIANPVESFSTAIASVVEAMLLSPSFLYRLEGLGDDVARDTDGDGVVKVTDYEMASRLSFLFWASAPDILLLDAAEAGELSTVAQIEAQAQRLLQDPKAERSLGAFHQQWLHLGELEYLQKDPAVYPFDDELRALLAEEMRLFLRSVVLNESGDHGTFEDLLTADHSFLNPRLREHYGLTSEQTGDLSGLSEGELREVIGLPNRAGILTQAALLSVLSKQDQSSPILRGVFVREQLLCEIMAPPPDDVDIQPPDPDPNLSTRERFAEHTENPSCQGCHVMIDPVGFGFEDFDGIGRHRTEENGIPVDNSGSVEFTFSESLVFNGPVDLSQQLATKDVPKRCYAKQWFRFGMGRAEQAADACGLDAATDNFLETGDIQAFLLDLTKTNAFRYRAVQDPSEVTP